MTYGNLLIFYNMTLPFAREDGKKNQPPGGSRRAGEGSDYLQER